MKDTGDVVTEPTPEQIADTLEWLATRPAAVKARFREYPPGLYSLRPHGQRVLLYSYELDLFDRCDTCTVDIHPSLNPGDISLLITGPRRVFGIKFEDLAPIEVSEWVRRLEAH